MGSILSRPKAQDTSKQQALLDAQEARVKQQELETKRREAASSRARRARTASGGSLLTGDEQGVKSTLG